MSYTIEVLLGHEFGHHIQHYTGMLTASHMIQRQTATEAEGNLENRRRELQVQCFSGIGVGATADSLGMTAADYALLTDPERLKDYVTHGTAAHQASWLAVDLDRKSTRLNSSHQLISYAVFCLKKKI